MLSPEAPGKGASLPLPFLALASSPWHSLTWRQSTPLCAPITAWPSPGAPVSKFPSSCEDASKWVRARPDLEGPRSNSTDYIFEDFISK